MMGKDLLTLIERRKEYFSSSTAQQRWYKKTHVNKAVRKHTEEEKKAAIRENHRRWTEKNRELKKQRDREYQAKRREAHKKTTPKGG